MFEDDDAPDDEGLGFLESYELPAVEAIDGRPVAPILDEEWDA